MLSEEIVEKLEYFNDKGGSHGCGDNDLYLGYCDITNEILNEIILKWFIKKKLFNKIKTL